MSGSWNTDLMPHRRRDRTPIHGGCPAELHNELEGLADVARHEIEVSRTSVSAGFSPEAREACAAITARLAAAGVGKRLAELATTRWILVPGRPVWDSVEKAREDEGDGR